MSGNRINELLLEILDDFKKYVDSNDKLCELIDLNFQGNHIPDYSVISVREFYLLRYMYAYAFEYKFACLKLKRYFSDNTTLSVLSVGCGSAIDYWAFTSVFNDYAKIIYTGVDRIQWYKRFDSFNGNIFNIFQQDAVSYVRNLNFLDYDVFFFPKSISEFDITAIKGICSAFSKKTLVKDRIAFVFSLRANDDNLESDKKKTKLIKKSIIDCGYHCITRDNVFGYSGKGEKIRQVDNTFEHPFEVYGYLEDLQQRCKNLGYCDKKDQCSRSLKRHMTVNCDYVRLQMMVFDRN